MHASIISQVLCELYIISYIIIVRRIVASVIVSILIGSLGVASALSNTVFVNQDTVWAQAQILSGCLLIYMVLRYGVLRFRRNLYNDVS